MWDGEIALALFLDAHPEVIDGKTVLELGSGVYGLAGIVSKILGAERVLLTDLAYCREPVLNNCSRNFVNCDFRILDWNKPISDLPNFEVVIAADVVWVEGLVEGLISTICAISFDRLILVHQSRCRAVDAKFFGGLCRSGLKFRVLESIAADFAIYEVTSSSC